MAIGEELVFSNVGSVFGSAFQNPSLQISNVKLDGPTNYVDSLKQVFSQADNYAQVFELHQQVHALHQRELSDANYAKTLTSLWRRLDYFDPFNASCVADGTIFRQRMDRERMYRFPAGLNEEYDGLRSQLLIRSPPPTLNEACAAVQHEELRRQAMRRPVRVENATISETQSFVRLARLQCEHFGPGVLTEEEVQAFRRLMSGLSSSSTGFASESTGFLSNPKSVFAQAKRTKVNAATNSMKSKQRPTYPLHSPSSHQSHRPSFKSKHCNKAAPLPVNKKA
ncbi:hypothetical protein Drorol1_Dr00020160 [Drosera rotundifolia]